VSKNNFKILGIETSCDETAAAVIEYKGGYFEIKSNIVSSQIDIHKKYGGVVPEVAARAHLEKILPVLKESLIKNTNIDTIAVTSGPGLITSLIVGMEAAKTLSFLWNKPLVPVNHLAGHIYAAFLENKKIEFPALALVVSGGHTELIFIKQPEKFKKIGQTLDDAAGECFDKVARILELGYPGGPIISTRAAAYNIDLATRNTFKLPRPMINSGDFNFSFSGLKTAILYLVHDKKYNLINHKKEINKKQKLYSQKIQKEKQQFINQLCAEVQQAIIDVLIYKTIKAAQKYCPRSIILCGGVAANKELRRQLEDAINKNIPSIAYYVPRINLCTDNAAMIAVAGYFKKIYSKKSIIDSLRIRVNPNLEI